MMAEHSLHGLQAIKDYIDEEGTMSMTYFRDRILPELRKEVLCEKGWCKFGENRFWCLKTHLDAWILSKKKM